MEINNIEQFSNDLRKATTKVISPINNNESKQRNEETNENSLKLPVVCSKRGFKVRLFLILFLIGLKTGARVLRLSVSVVTNFDILRCERLVTSFRH